MKCFSNGALWTPRLERVEINGSLCSLTGDLNETMKRFEANRKGQLSIADLEMATGNFEGSNLMGKGDFSAVYIGWIHQKTFAPSRLGTDTAVAIKKFNLKLQQLSKEWQLHVKFLEGLSHPNLVKLLGHCCEEDKLLLVCEFMARKSLDGYLFGVSPTIFPWNVRIKIAIGASRGLDFLHTLEKKAIHGDMKSSNMLLGVNYNAKLKDYGLALLWRLSDNNTCRRAMDIHGYAAPESLATDYFDAKSDVYGFGVVLLELMTGLRAFDINRPNGQQNLVEWLKPIPLRKGPIKSIMDARIEGGYPTKAVLLAAKLALKCVDFDAENRPSMKEVVEALDHVDTINKGH